MAILTTLAGLSAAYTRIEARVVALARRFDLISEEVADFSVLAGASAMYCTGLTALVGTVDRARVYCDGYAAAGDGGGGDFVWYLGSTTTANGGTVFGAGTGRWKRTYSGAVHTPWFGAFGTSSDMRTLFQAALDAAKGNTLLVTRDVMISGVTLDGSTYNGTRVVCDGADLKLAPDTGGASTFGGAWIGILVRDCSRVYLDLRMDCNRSAMTAREQIFGVAIAGASHVAIHRLDLREVRGDGLYISTLTWGSNTTNSSNIRVGTLSVVNTADDGRNALSVISCAGLHVDSVYSYKVGGLIGATRMPGGIDLEPDSAYQIISDVTIGNANITSAGTSGFQIYGKAQTNDAARDWNIYRVRIGNLLLTRTHTVALAAASIIRASHVTINADTLHTASYGQGWGIDFADNISGRLVARHVVWGLHCGYTGSLRSFDLSIEASEYTEFGLLCADARNGTFKGRISNSSAANSTPIYIANIGRAVTQIGVVYSIDCPYDANTLGGYTLYHSTPAQVAFTECSVKGGDHSGAAATYGPAASVLPMIVSVPNAVQSYTPALTSSAGSPAIGNGTLLGYYSRAGAVVTAIVDFTVGSTTNLGTGDIRLSLPSAPLTVPVQLGSGYAVDVSVGTNYSLIPVLALGVSYCTFRIDNVIGAVQFNSPVTWATGDTMRFSISYVAAQT